MIFLVQLSVCQHGICEVRLTDLDNMMHVYMLIGLNVVFMIQKTHKLYLILKYLILHKAAMAQLRKNLCSSIITAHVNILGCI